LTTSDNVAIQTKKFFSIVLVVFEKKEDNLEQPWTTAQIQTKKLSFVVPVVF